MSRNEGSSAPSRHVQCGSRVTNDSGNETYESIRQIASQLVDFIDLMAWLLSLDSNQEPSG